MSHIHHRCLHKINFELSVTILTDILYYYHQKQEQQQQQQQQQHQSDFRLVSPCKDLHIHLH
jgi:hypothetical protein